LCSETSNLGGVNDGKRQPRCLGKGQNSHASSHLGIK
jgi:hypothetical protein